MDQTLANYRQLDERKIVETIAALHRRIQARFPESGLGNVVGELLRVAEETVTRIQWIQKPHTLLRCAALVLTAAMMALLAGMLFQIRQIQIAEYTNFVQALEASISSIVFIGAAILFLVSWEHRIKRDRVLKAIHELRALAHIIDMHQLTKDPESYFAQSTPAASPMRRRMTPFELNRYLDYCSESVALISKVAVLYVQAFQDPVLLDAVDDVENLTAGFSRKNWKNLTILETLGRSLPAER